MEEETMFEKGDQDYGSAYGWDPDKERKEKIQKHIEKQKKKNPREFAEAPEMLYVQQAKYFLESGSQCGTLPQMFGPFWLENETTILFGPTGVGKSVLATQIAESLARGVPFAPFENRVGTRVDPQRVLYIDFELNRTQFAHRYARIDENNIDLKDVYGLSENFLRAEMYWNGQMLDGYEDYTDQLFQDIENKVDEHSAQVLIVDNISFLSRSSTANASIAFRLMRRLRDLKHTRFISILVLAHTPKRRISGPLTEYNLQGSVDLAKVADSVVAIGRSHTIPGHAYLKHLKCRTGIIEHDEDNVALFKIEKYDFGAVMQPGADIPRAKNFLGFNYLMTARELDHVEPRSPEPSTTTTNRSRFRAKLVLKARELAAAGLSLTAIAAKLNIGKLTAHRYITGLAGEAAAI